MITLSVEVTLTVVGTSRQDELLEARRHALSDSLRLRIREAVSMQPKTVKQIGEHLDVIPNRLYYHLRILEAAELIEVVGTTTTGRKIEKLYGPAGGNFGSELPGDDPSERAVFFASVLEATKVEFTDNVLADFGETADDHPTFASLLRTAVVCDVAERDAFWQELTDLLDTYNNRTVERIEASGGKLPDGLTANLVTIAFYETEFPEPDEEPKV